MNNFSTLGPLNSEDELIEADMHSPSPASSTLAMEPAGLPDPDTRRSEIHSPSPVRSPGDRLPGAIVDDEKESQIDSKQEPGDDPGGSIQPEQNTVAIKPLRVTRPSFSEKLQIEINEMTPPGPYPPSGTTTPQPWSPPQSPSLMERASLGSPSAPVVGMSGDGPYRPGKSISEQTRRLNNNGMTVNSEGQAYISNSERPSSPMFIMNGPATATRLRSDLIKKFGYSPREAARIRGEDGDRFGSESLRASPRSPTNVSPDRFRASSATFPRGPRRPATSPAIIMDDGAPRMSPPSYGGRHKGPTPGWSP